MGLDEIREVATIGLTHVCNHKHVPLLEAQLQVRCVQRWLLAAEATLQYHRLQISRLVETELKWLGAVLWARLELRTIAAITRQTGSNAVQQAIDSQQTELLEAIMRVDGFPTNVVDDKSQTLLHRVVIGLKSTEDFAELLLDAGVDVNYIDSKGKNVLHYAVENGNYGVLPKLMERGAQLDTRTSEGLNVL